jgi:hypothetical protein
MILLLYTILFIYIFNILAGRCICIGNMSAILKKTFCIDFCQLDNGLIRSKHVVVMKNF